MCQNSTPGGVFYIPSTTEAESLGTVSWLQRDKNINSEDQAFTLRIAKYEEEEEEKEALHVLTWKGTPCVTGDGRKPRWPFRCQCASHKGAEVGLGVEFSLGVSFSHVAALVSENGEVGWVPFLIAVVTVKATQARKS